MQWKAADISTTSYDHLQSKAAVFKYYSLNFDKNADVEDTAQLSFCEW